MHHPPERRGDPLEQWYRAAIAETMRPCPEYHNIPRTTPQQIPRAEPSQQRAA